MVIIQNSVYFLGDQIFDGMAEPVLTKALTNYQWKIDLEDSFAGQNAFESFYIDARNTHRPFIGEGYMDFWINGELKYKD